MIQLEAGDPMLHCPYCGTNVKEDEQYCIKCGKHLPLDMHNRLNNRKQLNKYWYIPLFITAVLLVSSGVYYLILQNQTAQAKELYEQGERSVLEKDYKAARDLFGQALHHKKNFKQASISLKFTDHAIKIESSLASTDQLLERQDYQEALSVINKAQGELGNFNGTAVSELIDTIISQRNTIKIAQLNEKLKKEPHIDELKILLWDAEAINNNEAKEITLNIRNQIIEYFFSKASEQLNNKQFNDAQILVEDGLKYAPDSEKLQSLKTTIDKEKTTFETAQQQRIEQAMNSAAKEQQFNETDAIELLSVDVEKDEQGKLVVKGKVKSHATIPINSVLIVYTLLNEKKTKILSNEVFVYPDKLYPDQVGKFEFTHFDMKDGKEKLNIKVNKITWYTH